MGDPGRAIHWIGVLMFPKKGRVRTRRERGRFLSLIWGMLLIPLFIFGIYSAATEQNLRLLLLTIGATIALAVFFFSSERSHRGEP